MTEAGIPDDRLKRLLERAGVDAEDSSDTRRRHPRFKAEGEVRFHRPMEKAEHGGRLSDISRGGLSFVTDVSLAVGETLLLSYEEDGKPRSAQASVETIHAHPKDKNFLVGAKFVR
jgi:hypothetical protein